MSLQDEFDALPVVHQPRCRTCRWLSEQDQHIQEAFWRAVDRVDPEEPYYKPIFDLCRHNGLDVGSKSFRDHCRTHRDQP